MTDRPGESPELTETELGAAHALASGVPPSLRSSFEERLAAWKATWGRPGLRLRSDTRAFTQGPEFDALVDLGREALPLVVEQLAHTRDGFFLLAALERWQERADLVATTAEHPLESQQSRARRAVRDAVQPG
jgi:hypothetical protein